MAEVVLDPLDPGDVLNAASINTRMDGIRLAVNDVEADAVAPGAFNSAHLPSLVRDSKQLIVGSATATHTYNNIASTYPGTWTDIAQGGTPLILALASTFPLNAADVGGCLVLADIYVKSIRGAVATHNHATWRAFVQVEVNDGTGTWLPIPRSQRWVRSGYATGTTVPDQLIHIPIRTLITLADITTVSVSISQVKVTISLEKNGGPASNMEVTLRECSLSAIVLHGPRE